MVFKKAGTIPEGEGVVLNKFYTGRPPPLPFTRCPFINYFSQESFPFHLPCFDKWYPFLLPTLLELSFLLTAVNAMSFEMNQPQNQNFFGLFSAINLSLSPFGPFYRSK